MSQPAAFRLSQTPSMGLGPPGTDDEGATRPPSILLEEALIASPHSTEFERTPERDYIERLTRRQPHIAELFQLNTQISPHSQTNTALDEEACSAARRWYVATSFRPQPGDIDGEAAAAREITMPLAAVGGGAARWLACLSAPAMVDLAYPLHLMLVRPQTTHRITPDGRTLWVDRYFDEHDHGRFVDALLGDGAREPAALHLVIAVAAWRYMVFQGPRGYRRALFDAGRFLTELDRAAVGAGVRIAPIYDFHDVRLDRLLNLDGVDRSAIAVVAYLGEDGQPQTEEL